MVSMPSNDDENVSLLSISFFNDDDDDDGGGLVLTAAIISSFDDDDDNHVSDHLVLTYRFFKLLLLL